MRSLKTPFVTVAFASVVFSTLALTSPLKAQAAPQTGSQATSTRKDSDKIYHVRLETEKGDIDLELDGVHAPISTQNFLKYINHDFLNNGIFHRVVTMDNQPHDQVKIEVIQGGPDKNGTAFPPIPLERTSVTGIHHLNGTVSMARSADTDSATSDFFICIHDQPELDFGGKRNPDGQGFAAFGHVLKGMDVVTQIQTSPSQDQTLTPLIRIKRAFVY